MFTELRVTKHQKIRFHIITLFPEVFAGYLRASIIGRAIAGKKLAVLLYNPRDFTKDKHARVDRRPYGGGPGMVLEALPVVKAVEAALKRASARKTRKITGSVSRDTLLPSKPKANILFLSPSGRQFTSADAQKLAEGGNDIVIIAGHYEGVDARIIKILKAKVVSIGPYVLTGGELPAMTIIDAVARHISGVLGKEESLEENRIASSEVYTRPEVLEWKGKKYRVPKVLLSGDHKRIEDWKKGKQTKA